MDSCCKFLIVQGSVSPFLKRRDTQGRESTVRGRRQTQLRQAAFEVPLGHPQARALDLIGLHSSEVGVHQVASVPPPPRPGCGQTTVKCSDCIPAMKHQTQRDETKEVAWEVGGSQEDPFIGTKGRVYQGGSRGNRGKAAGYGTYHYV